MRSYNWYECIEKPLRELVYELRNNGFNTVCSCAHYPHPYIEMEWYDDGEPKKLWNLLTELGYKRWVINAYWGESGRHFSSSPNWGYFGERHIRIEFDIPNAGIKKGMMKIEDVK